MIILLCSLKDKNMNSDGLKFKSVPITSCANNTKWTKLRERMLDLSDQAPQFLISYLPEIKGNMWELNLSENLTNIEPKFETFGWDDEWYHHFRYKPYKFIECVDLKPSPESSRIGLAEMSVICRDISLEFEVHHDWLRVFGYRRGSASSGE